MSEKRSYTMSEKALEQRRAASALSTGPKTDDGKAASSRNAWKHGEYSAINNVWQTIGVGITGKPCQSTCPQYPCTLVTEGVTQPGDDCKDKTVFVSAFNGIMDVLTTGDVVHVHGMMAQQAAGVVEVLQLMRDQISSEGVLVKQPIVDKSGKIVGYKYLPNPILGLWQKLLNDFGISLPEMMATPRQVAKLTEDDEKENALAKLFANALSRAGGAGPVRRQTIDVESEVVK